MPTHPVNLLELAAKFRQKGSESITGWLLWLWDIGTDGILLTGDELKHMSSVTIHPSFRPRIHMAEARAGRTTTLLMWLMAGCRAVWPSEGDLPSSNPCWTSLLELRQFIRELGM